MTEDASGPKGEAGLCQVLLRKPLAGRKVRRATHGWPSRARREATRGGTKPDDASAMSMLIGSNFALHLGDTIAEHRAQGLDRKQSTRLPDKDESRHGHPHRRGAQDRDPGGTRLGYPQLCGGLVEAARHVGDVIEKIIVIIQVIAEVILVVAIVGVGVAISTAKIESLGCACLVCALSLRGRHAVP